MSFKKVDWTQIDPLIEDAILVDPESSVTAIAEALQAEGYDVNRTTVWRRLARLGLSERSDRVQRAIEGRQIARDIQERPDLQLMVSDKKEGSFNWREANQKLRAMQDLIHRASWSQDEATIGFPEATEPIGVIFISDWHWGSFATDYEAIERITDDILSIPNLYLACLGDMEQAAIKFRSVLEMLDNCMPMKLQHAYSESWLAEIEHKVLFSTWDNHSIMRQENQAGYSRLADIFSRKVIYHGHIGHPDVIVGQQTYKMAVSHSFRGRSITNPLHSQMRYLRMEAPDREICAAGDSHLPGFIQYPEGGAIRTCVNSGTLQIDSGYGKRFFSLRTFPMFPVLELDPYEHSVTPFKSVGDWLRVTGMGSGRDVTPWAA